MTQDLHIRIHAELGQNLPGSHRVQVEKERDLFVEQNINAHSLTRLPYNDPIQPILWIVRGPFQIELGTQPPVSDVNLLFGIVQRMHYVLHVHGRVHIPSTHLIQP